MCCVERAKHGHVLEVALRFMFVECGTFQFLFPDKKIVLDFKSGGQPQAWKAACCNV
jgi:hypothetical protein